MSTASSRPSKRQRPDHGGSYHDTIPFLDDFHVIHAREGRLLRVARDTVWTAPAERSPHRDSDPTWTSASSWGEPIDDPDLALDPSSDWYDEVVSGEVMETSGHNPTVASLKKQKRSKVSRRPHVVWKDLHRQSYLEEIIRWAGRGDFKGAKDCPDCLVRRVTPGIPEYRCLECFIPDLVCLSCCVKRHRCHPLHRISKWTGSCFEEVTLKSMGLVVQLNHSGTFCEVPIACHSAMLVLHSNGIHQVALQYCGCSKAIPQHLQLLRRGLYPASQLSVKTCASFQLLDLLHKFALTTKSSTYDFYRALEKLTNNTGIGIPKQRYQALFRMCMQWRHLKMLKWGGRGHDPSGAVGTKSGELAVVCPSCPHPGINLPDGWENAPIGMRFLYMMFVAMDANFRLKNQLVSNFSQDPGLGIGWAYMLPREGYERYILSRTKDGDISTCVGLQALAQANTKFSKGLRYTGVGGTFCGRSEMILRVGNLQKGERYPNMDFLIGSTIHAIALLIILISYDIACQWFINLFARIDDHWPEEIIPSATQLIPAIPKLHEPMHGRANHEVYSLNFIPGVGKSDLETPERVWSAHNALGNSTKTQGPGGRHDVLDDHFGFWNWLKYVGLGKTLMSKYKAAIVERNIQVEGHRGLTQSLDSTLVASWETMCVEWEGDSLPKTKANPYYTEGLCLTEAQERKALAEEEEGRIARGDVSLHTTSASAFVFLALELEDVQRRIRRRAHDTSSSVTIHKEGTLTEQRNILRKRLRGWEQLLPIYMPGLLQYQADLASGSSTAPPYSPPPSANPEDADIWLPSRIAQAHRSRVCREGLAEIEERIRTAQCFDALDAIRHTLTIKSRMVLFKNKNVRGQRDGTRSRSVIDRVHERARAQALKYRAAREAKYALSGGGPWEEVLRVLMDGDVRAYQDKNRLRVRRGRLGTLDDEQVEAARARATVEDIDMEDGAGISLDDEDRTKRDGTGETRRTLSWIWTTKSRTPQDGDETDEILRSEWAKSRARANRCKEEVLLLKEEMRRVLVFLEWKSKWWVERQELREGLAAEMDEGMRAFAIGQANLQRNLAIHFREIWKGSLHDEMGNTEAPGDGVNDGEEDDEDDDSDEDDNDDHEGDGEEEGDD